MLKFLTHKLRTQSLNEDCSHVKTDDDHDSGTESDDEIQDGTLCAVSNDASSPMESLGSPCLPDSAVPSDTDFSVTPPFVMFGKLCRESSEDLQGDEREAAEENFENRKFQEHSDVRLTYSDRHSSEEELEVINSKPNAVVASKLYNNYRTVTTVPEKRKWSQVSGSGNGNSNSNSANEKQQQQQDQQKSSFLQEQDVALQQRLFPDAANTVATTCSAPVSRAGRDPGEGSGGSGDEEVQGLLNERRKSSSVISQPVQFRTSPPIDVHKPGRSLSPPPKLFHASTIKNSRTLLTRPISRPRPQSHSYSNSQSHLNTMHLDHHHHHHYHHYFHDDHHHHHHHYHHCEAEIDTAGACSPRKRQRPPHRLPRPCLDFEKMQQLKARAVTTWRHSGEHGNELSVFCW